MQNKYEKDSLSTFTEYSSKLSQLTEEKTTGKQVKKIRQTCN